MGAAALASAARSEEGAGPRAAPMTWAAARPHALVAMAARVRALATRGPRRIAVPGWAMLPFVRNGKRWNAPMQACANSRPKRMARW